MNTNITQMKHFLSLKTIILLLFLNLFGCSLFSIHRMVAEWEPMRGVLIRHPFGIPASLIYAMAEHDTVFILVQDAAAQNLATNTLTAENTNMDHCIFITADTNSHWTRDWGPHSIFVNDEEFSILDPIFDGYPWVPGFRDTRPYEDDDAVNGVLADFFAVPLVDFPAYLTGGNFMTDGKGVAWSTAQMISENINIMSSDQFLQLATQSMGLSSYHFTINPELHGIQHIDCWAKLLNEETVLVKQLPLWHPEYDRAEQIANQFANLLSCWANPYRIVRIFCDTYNGTDAAAYTNSLILNKRVYVPTFGIAADQIALQTYADAMPGYEIIGFDGSWYYYDALHCRVMGIADGEMLYLSHASPPAVSEISDGNISLSVQIKSYGNHELNSAELLCYYRTDPEADWSISVLSPSDEANMFQIALSDLQTGDNLQYCFAAADISGRIQKLPIMAPQAFYSTLIDSTPTALSENNAPPNAFRLYPNPAYSEINISWQKPTSDPLQIQIYNLRGQLIHQDILPYEPNKKDYRYTLPREKLIPSLYLLRINHRGESITKKLLLLEK